MIGVQVTVPGINGQAGQLAGRWQQLAGELQQFAATVGALSHSDLVALGFTSGDATLMAAFVSNLAAFAGVYYGTATQSPAFNYDANFLLVRGFN
jgi:hypothetical protein